MPILQWLHREETIYAAQRVPYRLLKVDPELSYGEEKTENMIIQGDNLAALKALLPYYAGKVKCIFIDPPYNTKSAFEHYDDNLEHSQWLDMMYPRLELLRALLAEDGSIWVTIDDNEAHYLKVIMDEIFGRKNFVANVIWQKKHTRANDAKWFSDNHDHIICFARNKNFWKLNLLARHNDMSGYSNIDSDPRGPWASGPCHVKTPNPKDIYEIITPGGRKLMPPAGTSWRFSQNRFSQLIKENRIYFGKNGNNVPRYKRFRTEVQEGLVPITIWLGEEVGHNQDAKIEVKIFNSTNVFSTPKPEKLIHRILTLATNENDLVLDSFLGSGTTAAVAHKMGRHYIGIEMGEHAKTHCAARLKEVIDSEQGGISKDVNWKGGGGFRFYTLGETIFDEKGHINPQIRFQHLAAHIWFSETHTAWQSNRKNSPLLGVHHGVAYYLLYNGILGDKRPDGGNVLTSKVLMNLPPHDGPKIIYGETSRLGIVKLNQQQITFKQTPYDIKAG